MDKNVDVEKFKKLWKQGKTDEELAEKLKCDISTIWYLRDRFDFSPNVECKEEAWKIWEEELKDYHGWFTVKELKNLLEPLANENLVTGNCSIRGFMNWINQRGNVEIIKSRCGQNGTKYFVENNRKDRYKKYKEQIPDRAEDIFDELLSEGKNPKVIAAAIRYVVNDKLLQKEAANEFGVSTVSVRNLQDRIKEELGEER